MALKLLLIISQILACSAVYVRNLKPAQLYSLESLDIDLKQTESVTFRLQMCQFAGFKLATETSRYNVDIDGDKSTVKLCARECEKLNLEFCREPGTVTVSWSNRQVAVTAGCDLSAVIVSSEIMADTPPLKGSFFVATDEPVKTEFGDDICAPPTTTKTRTTAATTTTVDETTGTFPPTLSSPKNSTNSSDLAGPTVSPNLKLPDLRSGSQELLVFSVIYITGAQVMFGVTDNML